jgi:hypothetical protein
MAAGLMMVARSRMAIMTRAEFEIVEKLVAAAWRRDQASCQILLIRLALTGRAAAVTNGTRGGAA